MNKEESLALYAQGREAWNAWAQRMLDERAALEREGKWATTRDDGRLEGLNEQTTDWLTAAKVDFSGHAFEDDVYFSWFKFPSEANFEDATFSKYAGFWWTLFAERARFERVAFKGVASFDEARFRMGAGFYRSAFFANTFFDRASFSAEVEFGEVAFSGAAGFSQARFEGDAVFVQAQFAGFADFEKATFEKLARFTAMRGDSYFSLQDAVFHEVPDFEQAHFAEAPRLDVTHIKLKPRVRTGRFWRRSTAFVEADGNGDGGATPGNSENGRSPNPSLPDTTARWRALKRLAVQGHDHEREMQFFAEEVRSLRGRTDKLLPNPLNLFRSGKPVWPGGGRYWFGLFYQAFSSFGASILRPLIWWAMGIVGFALAYLSQHLALTGRGIGAMTWFGQWVWSFLSALPEWVSAWVPRLEAAVPAPHLFCMAGPGDAWSAALQLSVRKAMLFAGLDSTDKLNQIYACLYGLYAKDKVPAGQLPEQFQPVIPDFVSVLGLAQLVFSAVLIFLLLLAVRNQFRIK